MTPFAWLSVAVAIYAAYAALTGEVLTANGPFVRRVVRAREPIYFWTCVIIYAGLAAALATLF